MRKCAEYISRMSISVALVCSSKDSPLALPVRYNRAVELTRNVVQFGVSEWWVFLSQERRKTASIYYVSSIYSCIKYIRVSCLSSPAKDVVQCYTFTTRLRSFVSVTSEKLRGCDG